MSFSTFDAIVPALGQYIVILTDTTDERGSALSEAFVLGPLSRAPFTAHAFRIPRAISADDRELLNQIGAASVALDWVKQEIDGQTVREYAERFPGIPAPTPIVLSASAPVVLLRLRLGGKHIESLKRAQRATWDNELRDFIDRAFRLPTVTPDPIKE